MTPPLRSRSNRRKNCQCLGRQDYTASSRPHVRPPSSIVNSLLLKRCATSLVIVNKFHQVVIRAAEKERSQEAEKRNKKVCID